MFIELAFFDAKKDEAIFKVGDLQFLTETLNLKFVKWDVEVWISKNIQFNIKKDARRFRDPKNNIEKPGAEK